MLANNNAEYVFTLKDGKKFNDQKFRKIWILASCKAGVDYRKPYTTRHTFVAWSHVYGIHLDTVVRLMGHNSREMVFRVYGRPKKGLEKDFDKIQNFYGKDFMAV